MLDTRWAKERVGSLNECILQLIISGENIWNIKRITLVSAVVLTNNTLSTLSTSTLSTLSISTHIWRWGWWGCWLRPPLSCAPRRCRYRTGSCPPPAASCCRYYRYYYRYLPGARGSCCWWSPPGSGRGAEASPAKWICVILASF